MDGALQSHDDNVLVSVLVAAASNPANLFMLNGWTIAPSIESAAYMKVLPCSAYIATSSTEWGVGVRVRDSTT